MSSEESSASRTATTTADNNSEHSDISTPVTDMTHVEYFVERIMRGPFSKEGTPEKYYEVKWKGFDE